MINKIKAMTSEDERRVEIKRNGLEASRRLIGLRLGDTRAIGAFGLGGGGMKAFVERGRSGAGHGGNAGAAWSGKTKQK